MELSYIASGKWELSYTASGQKVELSYTASNQEMWNYHMLLAVKKGGITIYC